MKRPLILTAFVAGLAAATLAPACGGSDSPSTTVTVSATVGSGGAGSGGDGSDAKCVAIADVSGFALASSTSPVFAGVATPNLGGADEDYVGIVLTEKAVGTTTLKPPKSTAGCGTDEICVLLEEDSTQDGAAAYYFAKAGTVDVTKYDGKFLLTGKMTNVVFEEVTIDDASGDVTPVPNGKCAALASFTFDIKPPADGWTCNPAYYDETKAGASEIFCDCNCGTVDPDCANPANSVDGCYKGQTCGMKATCEGTPEAWTCAPAKFNGGKGNGCDCGCGVPDPDCELMPAETVAGCMANEFCGEGKCVPSAWKCDLFFYDEKEAGPSADVCDCGCGAMDPDCSDKLLGSCDYCNDKGSCSDKECKGNTQIDPMNNAVCK